MLRTSKRAMRRSCSGDQSSRSKPSVSVYMNRVFSWEPLSMFGFADCNDVRSKRTDAFGYLQLRRLLNPKSAEVLWVVIRTDLWQTADGASTRSATSAAASISTINEGDSQCRSTNSLRDHWSETECHAVAVGILPPGHVYNCAEICTIEGSAEGGGERLRRRDVTYTLRPGPKESMHWRGWNCGHGMQVL